MADDRPTYRPRRALVEDNPTPEPEDTAGPQGTGATQGSSPLAPDAPRDGRFTEDEARPIYREAAADADAATVRTPSSTVQTAPVPAVSATGPAAGSTAGPTATVEAPAGSGSTRLSFAPRAPRDADDEESTTLLPRTGGRGDEQGLTSSTDTGTDDDLDDRGRGLGRKGRLALLVGAVAAVVAIGLVVMFAVIGDRAQPSGSGPSGPSEPASVTPSAAALLDEASMLSPEGARAIDARRTWTAGDTVRGPVPGGSGPGCLGSDPVEGAPTAQQTITRALSASGSGAPSALHVAQAYGSVEDATQAYAATARALGTCVVSGSWLPAARALSGVGDEAVAVAVDSIADGQTTRHWVTMSRTGRGLDVVDASAAGPVAPDVTGVTRSLASVVGAQCAAAGGACATAPAVKDGPPPAGGDEPGFLTTGDLPPVGPTTAPWVGTPVEAPADDFSGSQCETVTWSTTAAATRTSRVYLQQDVPGIFGLNEIVLTVKDPATAAKLVDKIRGDWASCKERKLTATVAPAAKVTGVAAEGAPVAGWTTEVQQKAGATTTRFRVGIASSGSTVAFVFLNPQQGLDVSASAWDVIAVRAVQRATQ